MQQQNRMKKEFDHSLVDKAKAIRLLILDVDGILTSGILVYGNEQIGMKGFHVRDGLGIKLLQQSGVKVAIISAKNNDSTRHRIKELQIEHVYLGHSEKRPVYEEIKHLLKLSDDQIAYMGDDLPDLPVLKRVGLAITVPDAYELILDEVNFITSHKSGEGAVREVCDLLMKAQGTYETVIKHYLS